MLHQVFIFFRVVGTFLLLEDYTVERLAEMFAEKWWTQNSEFFKKSGKLHC